MPLNNVDLYRIDGTIGSVSNIQTAAINNGQVAGMRNRIINGEMEVDQRNTGASQTFTAGAALAYSVDRWYGYCTGANVTGQQIVNSVRQFRYDFTGAASVTGIGFGQRIEQLNSADLAGSTATLSVDLANTLLTSVTWTAYYATTVNAFGTLASPTRTQIATGTFTINSALTRYSTQISIPGAAITGIEIVFTVGAQTSGVWQIRNVQLEPGTVATPFERRSYGQELALCQRYYQVGLLRNNVGNSLTYAGLSNLLPVVLRTAGTATFRDFVGNASKLSTSTGDNIGIATGTLVSTVSSVILDVITASNLTNWWALQFVLSAEL